MLGFFPLEGEVSPADYEDEVRTYQAQYDTLATLKEGKSVRIAELEGRWLEFATLLPPEAPASLALGEASLGGMALFAGEVHLLLPPPLITYDYSLTTAHCLLPLTTPYFLLLTTYYLLLLGRERRVASSTTHCPPTTYLPTYLLPTAYC